MQIDRVNLNRALAKAIAYKQCGKDDLAAKWAVQLVRELACRDILNPEAVARLDALRE